MLVLLSRYAWSFGKHLYMQSPCWGYRSPGIYRDYEPLRWLHWTRRYWILGKRP